MANELLFYRVIFNAIECAQHAHESVVTEQIIGEKDGTPVTIENHARVLVEQGDEQKCSCGWCAVYVEGGPIEARYYTNDGMLVEKFSTAREATTGYVDAPKWWVADA